MKNREFRELQVSSTQLAVIFFGILIIGVVIFLLGVSVGKKHAAAAKTATALAQKAPEQVKDRLVVPEAKPAPAPSAETPVSQPQEKEAAPSAKAKEPAPRSEPAPPASQPPAPEKAAAPAVKTAPPAGTAQPLPETAAPAKSGYYYVQVGALAEKSEAGALAQRFRARGYTVVVIDPLSTDRTTVYRVRIGGFATRPEADAVLAELAAGASRRVDYFVVRD